MRTTRRVLGKVLRSGEVLALVPIGLQFMLPDPPSYHLWLHPKIFIIAFVCIGPARRGVA